MNITNIKIDEMHDIDNHYNEIKNGDDVYQFQPKENDVYCKLLIVGKTLNHSDVLVNKFDYKKYYCYIVSCLYNKKELEELNDTCIFPLIRLNICKNNKNHDFDSELSFNFHTFKHKQDNVSISTLCSNKDNINYLKGFFSIRYIKNNKIIYMENIPISPTNNNIIENLVETFVNLVSEKIIN